MEEYIGIIKIWSGSWIPVGYMPCDGRALQVNNYQALYTLLGYTYGGSGQTFNLPNLSDRIPAGVGLNTFLGVPNGNNTQTAQCTGILSINNVPPHTHPAFGTINVNNATGTSTDPSNMVIGNSGNALDKDYNNAPITGTMHPSAVTVTIGQSTGGNQPFTAQASVDVRQPSLGLYYIICVTGLYPSRP